MINAKQFNERQARRRLAEATARALFARREGVSGALGNEGLLIKPEFDPLQPLPQGPLNFAPPPLPPKDPRGNMLGKADAIMRGAAGVLTFEGADEGSAAANATLHPLLNTGNPGKNYPARYDKNLADERATDQSDEQNRYWYRKTGKSAAASWQRFFCRV